MSLSLYTRDPEMAFEWQLIWAERNFYARPRPHNSQVSGHVSNEISNTVIYSF